MARRRVRPSGGSFRDSPRRLSVWELGPGGDDLPTLDRVAISSDTNVIIGQGITPVVPHLTVVRIHGFLEISLNTAGAQRSGFNWAAGIGVVTSDAFAIGITAIPQPFSDVQWPGWMWHASGSIRTAFGALAIGDPSENPVVVPIETKSMRKLRLNEILMLTVQGGETGTSSMDVAGMTRVLLKLP